MDNIKDFLFNEEEFNILNSKRKKEKEYGNIKEWNSLETEFFNLLGFHNSKYHLSVDYCATNIIHNIMLEHASLDDTLLITSSCEHDIVKAHFKLFKNHIFIYHNTKNKFEELLKNINKYKNILIYHIGTSITDGEIFDNSFFLKLKAIIISHNPLCKITIVLDDVQGMFITPRDYSIFDYIIGTSHALIPNFDMGIVISKKDDYGFKITNWLKDYLTKIIIILKHYDDMKNISKYITSNIKPIPLPPHKTENIIAIPIPNEKHEKLISMLEDISKLHIHYDYTLNPPYHKFLRIRLSEFLVQHVNTHDIIRFIKNIMEK